MGGEDQGGEDVVGTDQTAQCNWLNDELLAVGSLCPLLLIILLESIGGFPVAADVSFILTYRALSCN